MKIVNPDIYNDSLSKEQIEQWRKNGYLLINNMIPENLLLKCKSRLDEIYPQLNSKNLIKKVKEQDFGSEGKLEFPTNYDEFNLITLDKNIIKSVKKLLNTEKILLTQSDIWSKYGANIETPENSSNQDQRIHVDYGNNYLTHPISWDKPESVAIIVYFDNFKDVKGTTAFVPNNDKTRDFYNYPLVNSPGLSGYPFINDKNNAEKYFLENNLDIYNFRQKLYDNELYPNYELGTVLFYRHDLWHRGTPVKDGQVRRVLNLGFKKIDCYWINNWNPGFSKKLAWHGDFEKFIAKIDVEQRTCLGFPHPKSKYWNKNTIAYLKARYEKYGMDIKPYLKFKDKEILNNHLINNLLSNL